MKAIEQYFPVELMVATGQEMVRENKNWSRSGNFILGQGKLAF